jgi:hypothetical protein
LRLALTLLFLFVLCALTEDSPPAVQENGVLVIQATCVGKMRPLHTLTKGEQTNLWNRILYDLTSNEPIYLLEEDPSPRLRSRTCSRISRS